jgi:protein-L-isoaspartate(D-aspartate) O-methyltransferase
MNDRWPEQARRMVRFLGPVPEPIAEAMRRVPRHEFVPPHFRSLAYRDEPVELAGGLATVSAPHMVALQLEAAELHRGDRVLEVGSGSGYLIAVAELLARPTERLVGYEVDPSLVADSRRTLARLGVPAEIVERDGREGVPGHEQFDAIVVSFATPELYPVWTQALVDGGRLVAPVGRSYEQVLTTYRRVGGGARVTPGPACRFVPLRPHI